MNAIDREIMNEKVQEGEQAHREALSMLSEKQRHWLNTFLNQAKLVLAPHPEPWFKEFLDTYGDDTREVIGKIERALRTNDPELGSELLGYYFAKDGPDSGVRRAIILYSKSHEDRRV